MNKNQYIGFFDSGMGGLSVLKETVKLLPNENYIYYGDSINNPYGSKDSHVLLEITSNIVDFLIDKGCKIIVIACNTATTVCIKDLRERYPNITFIGTVPAIKMAYDAKCKNTLVMATPYTLKTERVHELVETYTREDQEITLLPCINLAHTIETRTKEEITECVKDILKDYHNKNIDSIVLGCTHYSLIKDIISEVMPNVLLIDGCFGIAKEVRHQLELHDLLTENTNKGNVIIYNSKGEEYIKQYQDILEK